MPRKPQIDLQQALRRVFISIMKSVTIGFIACLTRTGWRAINMPLFIAFLKLPTNTAVALSVFTMFPSALPTIIKTYSVKQNNLCSGNIVLSRGND